MFCVWKLKLKTVDYYLFFKDIYPAIKLIFFDMTVNREIKHRFFILLKGGILIILLSLAFYGCKKDKQKCEGCDRDAPWSNWESSYCYPTELECVTETEKDCEKCN